MSIRTLADFQSVIDEYIRSKNSGIAFSLISRLTIIHPTRRDGGIMICYLDDNDELHAGQENVIENCLRVLEEISGFLQSAPRRFRNTSLASLLSPMSRLRDCSASASRTRLCPSTGSATRGSNKRKSWTFPNDM